MKKLQKIFKMFLRPANYKNFLSSLLFYSDEGVVEEFWPQNSRFSLSNWSILQKHFYS